MIKNYIKIAFRSVFRQKGYSALNIFGLAIALSVSLLMLLWVQDEWKMDKFHEEGDGLYVVIRSIPVEGDKYTVSRGVPQPLLAAAQEQIPEVKRYIPYRSSYEEMIVYKNNDYEVKGTFANTAFFESFSFPVLQGDVNQLDDNPKAIALSRTMAEKLFGNTWRTTALGETITLHDYDDFSVEIIYEDMPSSSTLEHDFVYSFQHFYDDNEWIREWTNSGMAGVLHLNEGADAEVVAAKLDELYKENQKDGDLKEGCFLQPYADTYLYGNIDDQAQVSGGRIEYVRTFAIAAFLLLIISCINFVNLSTALASRRAKEVGVRKTVGAGKSSLIIQFLTESAVITLLAMATAIVFGKVLEPVVQRLTGKELGLDLSDLTMWAGLLGMGILTTLLAGSYPAFVLSSFKPVDVLKGKLSTMLKHISLRKVLVILQFVFALLLIAGAITVRQQIHYIMNKNLGVAKENILEIPRDENIAENYAALKNELVLSPAILDVTSAGPSPLSIGSSTSGVQWPGKRPDQANQEFQILWAEQNFADLFEVPLADGEFYRTDVALDTNNIVLNEKAVEVMGIENPIGKSITWWGMERQIIGVVEDFHNQSLYSEILPTGIIQDRDGTRSLYVKAASGQLTAAMDHIQASFTKVVPAVPLRYEFLDDQYRSNYEAEILTGRLSNYFAIIAIIVSILGLLGLATYVAQQRKKEIGVRKVLGASIADLIVLLSKDFLLLVLIGTVVGLPIAWYFLGGWLDKFEFSVDLEWWMLAVPMVGALLVATLTVGLQSLRAAWQDPINSISEE